MYEKKVDKGSIFILVFLIVATTLGYLMVGGTLPTRLPGFNNNLVGIPSLPPYEPRNALQMRAFLGATITPYPTLEPAGESETNTALQDENCNHTLQGTAKPHMIWGLFLGSSRATNNQTAIKIFYADNYAMLLGSGTVSPMTQQPTDHIAKPNMNFGNLNQKDQDNLPYAPSLFLTDIANDPNSTSGDAQNNGLAQTPSDIYGSWKAFGAQNPPEANGTSLGEGDLWPPANGPDGPKTVRYTSELTWKLDDLTHNGQPLIPGNTYRAQIIVHNGNNLGDVGQVCTTIVVPTPEAPAQPSDQPQQQPPPQQPVPSIPGQPAPISPATPSFKPIQLPPTQ